METVSNEKDTNFFLRLNFHRMKHFGKKRLFNFNM